MNDNDIAINLLVVYTDDLETTRRFYELLGLSLKKEQHGKGVEHYAAVLGDMVFEIYPRTAGTTATAARLGFRVPSAAKCLEQLTTSDHPNVEILQSLRSSPWGLRAVVRDPGGNVVELVSLQ